MTWKIYHDEGGGVTDESIKLFESLKGKLGELSYLWIYRDDNSNSPLFSTEIVAENGVVLLSGTNCGYGGTGPHGSAKILQMIANQSDILALVRVNILSREQDIYKYGRVLIEFPAGVKW